MPELFFITWRVEGSTVIEARDSEQAMEQVDEMLTQWDLPHAVSHQTSYGDPEILGCLHIDPSEAPEEQAHA